MTLTLRHLPASVLIVVVVSGLLLVDHCCWCIIIFELGNDILLPAVPAINNNDPALADNPILTVEISGFMYFIVS